MTQFKELYYIMFITKDNYIYTLFREDFERNSNLLNRVNEDLRSGEIIVILKSLGEKLND